MTGMCLRENFYAKYEPFEPGRRRTPSVWKIANRM